MKGTFARPTFLAKSMRAFSILLVLSMAGCMAEPRTPFDEPSFMHVHGLGYLPGQLFVATHHGLIVGNESSGKWAWAYAGAERFDYMGFVQDAADPGVVYSSGHPDDPRAYGGVHLGLRRSLDQGRTWEQRSLKGEVDFHALTALPGEGWLAGFWQGAIKVSRDGGLTWTNETAPSAAVIALGSADGQLLAGTSMGLYRTTDLGDFTGWTKLPGPSNAMVSSIAASRDGANLLAGTGDGRTGSTYRSTDAGVTWTELTHGSLENAPGQVLFAFNHHDARHAFAALGDGKILETRDAGASWTKVR